MDILERRIIDGCRRPHHQVLGLLVHREQRDLADIGFIGQQHDDAINARGQPAMGRTAVLEGIIERAKAVLDILRRVAGNLEGLDHGAWLMVSDRAAAQFHAVAHDVVLVGQDIERIHAIERFATTLGHRKRVVAEVDLLGGLVVFVHRIIDDPAEAEGVLFNQAKLLTGAGSHQSGKPFGFALFYLRGVAPPQVRTVDIYRGVIPFVAIQLGVLGLLALFPSLVTWLPRALFGN